MGEPTPNKSRRSALALALLLSTPHYALAAETPEAPAAAAPAPAPSPTPVDKLRGVVGEQKTADAEATASQQRIDVLDDETQKMLADYRRAVADTESFDAYAAQLERQIQSQETEMAEIRTHLDEVEDTARSITPLMQKMVVTLEAFVGADIPFLLKERGERVARLREMMDRADVSISEKYRRILEAYQVELDYGRTVESYEGTIKGNVGNLDDVRRTVKFLRIGRLALVYQTLDGKETGYWDDAAKEFRVDDSYAYAFKEGVAVALKVRAPEMIVAPVPAPTEASL